MMSNQTSMADAAATQILAHEATYIADAIRAAG